LLHLELDKKPYYRILCLGAHSDDIEIGCGGTILRLVKEHKDLEFYWVVFSSDPSRMREALISAKRFLSQVRKKTVVVKEFRASFMPFDGLEIKQFFEKLKQDFSPDLVLTHYRNDLHQDHRLISELTWNSYRDHWILEYEIPKYDGDLGSPNFFVALDDSVCRRKIKYIFDCFKTQESKHWFTEDTFRALLRLRGVESCAPRGLAEAFYSRKIVF
jgi:LmbE family N-acetylglucosaminyl deacetylase